MPSAAWRPRKRSSWGWQGAGADLLEVVDRVHPLTTFRSPGPLHPAAELPQGVGRLPGEVGGGQRGGGLRARGTGVAVASAGAGGSVSERGEREARCCPWGEGEADMGRRWRVWWHSVERQRWWRGLGVLDAYRRCGDREVRCCSWGEGDVDMGQRWRVCWRSGERRRREWSPGGSWRRLRGGGAARVSG